MSAPVRQRKPKPPKVTDELREYILRRDGACFLWRLYPLGHSCYDRYGVMHLAFDRDRLSLEHVKDDLMAGKRAPSDKRHLVAICHAGNCKPPNKAERAAMRDYLARVEPMP